MKASRHNEWILVKMQVPSMAQYRISWAALEIFKTGQRK